jgi:hypothetical protein
MMFLHAIAKPEMLYPEAAALKSPRSQGAATLHKTEQLAAELITGSTSIVVLA